MLYFIVILESKRVLISLLYVFFKMVHNYRYIYINVSIVLRGRITLMTWCLIFFNLQVHNIKIITFKRSHLASLVLILAWIYLLLNLKVIIFLIVCLKNVFDILILKRVIAALPNITLKKALVRFHQTIENFI